MELTQKKIRQYENRNKMLDRKLAIEKRKERNHRLCSRGGYLESLVPALIDMSEQKPATSSTPRFQRQSAGVFEKTSRRSDTEELPLHTRAHYPRYSTIRGNFQIVAIYKDFKEISSDNLSLHDTVKVTKENRRL